MKNFWFIILCLVLINSSCSKLPTANATLQLKNDTTAIASYLKQNQISATKLSQGIWYSVDKASQGFRPTYNDTIIVTYTTKILSNGTVVDQSSQPTTFDLSTLISGIQLAMPFFQEGSSGRIFIPSYFAYGSSSNGNVPANSNLIFDFSLQKVYSYQLKIDTTTIGGYLRARDIQTQIDPSGLRYVVTQPGNSGVVNSKDSVELNYTVQIMSNNYVVDQSQSPIKFLFTDLIMAYQIGLPLITEGGSITIYSPSGLAYGPIVSNTVPANTNMIFKLQLVKIISN